MDVCNQLSPVNLPSYISPLPSLGIELSLFGYITGSNQRHYPLHHVSLRKSVYEFLGIINLISSTTIFTSAHIAILLLSLHFFLPFFLSQLCCYYWFSEEGWSVQQLKRFDKHGDKDEDNSQKNVNNVHNTSSQKYRQMLVTWSKFRLLWMLWKVTNYIALWDDELAWYTPSATHQIFFPYCGEQPRNPRF